MTGPFARTTLLAIALAVSAPLVSGGCGAPDTAPASAPTSTPAAASADDVAPYPYTVDQIRAGCHGRVLEYEMAVAGGPPKRQRWEFSDVDRETVTVTTTHLDADGKAVGAPESKSAKWTELHEHARFPRARATLSEETLTLPFGTLECVRYVVRGTEGTKTYWFAKTLPGPPVKMIVEKDGKTVMTMTMVQNRS